MDLCNKFSLSGQMPSINAEKEDALNDETFGAAEICDWEEEHEKLAEFDFSQFGSGDLDEDLPLAQRSGRSIQEETFGIPLPQPPMNLDLDDEDDMFNSEINLEEALRKLVTDDEEVLDDPAIVNVTKRPPGQIGGIHQYLSNNAAGFPPIPHVQGNFKEEMPLNMRAAHHPPNAGDMWANPLSNENRMGAFPQGALNSLPQLSDSLQRQQEQIGDNSHSHLLQRLLEQSKNVSMPSAQAVRTVDDIESEILKNSNSLPVTVDAQHLPTGQVTAIQEQLLQRQLHQQEMSVNPEALNPTQYQQNNAELGQSRPPMPDPKNLQYIQHQSRLLMQWANQALSNGVNPQEVQQAVHRNQQHISAQASRLGIPVAPPPVSRMPMFPGNSMGHPRSGFMPPPIRMLPPGIPPNMERAFLARMQFQMLQMMRSQNPQGAASMMHLAAHQQAASPGRAPNQDQYRGMPEWASPTGSDSEDTDIENIDPEKGNWMTPSEKDWLIKIQVRPLEVDNPYVQDYYWTIRKLRQLLNQRRNDIQNEIPVGPHPVLSLIAPVTADQLAACTSRGGPGLLDGGCNVPPQMQDSSGGGAGGNVTIKPYKVIQFENCLGKLTVSSIYFPRQVIDVPDVKDQVSEALKKKKDAPQKSSENSSRTELLAEKQLNKQRAYRLLLLTIERLFGKLLQIDEFDVSIAKILVTHNPNRVILETHRNNLVEELVKSTLQISPRLANLFAVKKGCRFFATLTSHLDNHYLKTCLKLFIKEFPHICSMKNDIDTEKVQMFSSFYSSLKRLNFHSTVSLLKACWKSSQTKDCAGHLVQHELGFSLIMALLERFSLMCESQHIDKFRHHCEKLTSRLKCLSEGSKCRALHDFCTVSELIVNHLSAESKLIYEEKVSIEAVAPNLLSDLRRFNPTDLLS